MPALPPSWLPNSRQVLLKDAEERGGAEGVRALLDAPIHRPSLHGPWRSDEGLTALHLALECADEPTVKASTLRGGPCLSATTASGQCLPLRGTPAAAATTAAADAAEGNSLSTPPSLCRCCCKLAPAQPSKQARESLLCTSQLRLPRWTGSRGASRQAGLGRVGCCAALQGSAATCGHLCTSAAAAACHAAAPRAICHQQLVLLPCSPCAGAARPGCRQAGA